MTYVSILQLIRIQLKSIYNRNSRLLGIASLSRNVLKHYPIICLKSCGVSYFVIVNLVII